MSTKKKNPAMHTERRIAKRYQFAELVRQECLGKPISSTGMRALLLDILNRIGITGIIGLESISSNNSRYQIGNMDNGSGFDISFIHTTGETDEILITYRERL